MQAEPATTTNHTITTIMTTINPPTAAAVAVASAAAAAAIPPAPLLSDLGLGGLQGRRRLSGILGFPLLAGSAIELDEFHEFFSESGNF